MRFPRYIILLDLFLCSLFAIPGLSDVVIAVINDLNAAFGLSGGPVTLSGGAGFFVNFGGLLGVVFNLALLDPAALRLHRINIVARGLVSLLVLYHIMLFALPLLYLVIVVTEFVGGLIEWRWLRQQE